MGMLLDRMSILAIKQWNMVHRARQLELAQELIRSQVEEIVWALATALPGQSSVNNKMTRLLHGRKVVSDFSTAYGGLLLTNTALWEAQEVLYNHDISALRNRRSCLVAALSKE